MSTKEERALVSVIVPVYNKELYLRECLDSVVNQTYQNLQILLVNDGSTDDSLAICQEYAQKDDRIRLFDVPNGGLSYARNIGLSEASGDYVSFIDADDRFAPNMIEYLLTSSQATDADIAIANLILFSNNAERLGPNQHRKETLLSGEEALKLLFQSKLSVGVWDKLYKRDLFFNPDVQFPIGMIGEDQLVTPQLFLKTNRIFQGNRALYYYRQDVAGSITNGLNVKIFDILTIRKQVYQLVMAKMPQLKEYLNSYMLSVYLGHKLTLEKAGSLTSSKQKEIAEQINYNFKAHFAEIMGSKYISWKFKGISLLLKTNLYTVIRSLLLKIRKV